MKKIDDFATFIQESPTAFHAVEAAAKRLKKAGFKELKLEEKWKLEKGKAYYVISDGSLLSAFRLPKKKPTSSRILASHVDSPSLKLKPKPSIFSGDIEQIGVEVYGGPLLHTWLDRDLLIGGRASFLSKNGRIESKTVLFEEHPLTIPSIAPHLERSISEKGILVHKQDHLKPFFSLNAKEKSLEKLLKNYLSFDLFLVPKEKPAFLGARNEMFSSYRLDNLSSVHSSLDALLRSKEMESTLQVAVLWDHEEVGSVSSRGANSLFLSRLLKRVTELLSLSHEEHLILEENSLCLSIDVAHGLNPNFQDKYDPENTPLLGKGIALKFSANQRYATSSQVSASLLALAKKHQIPMQLNANRSNIPSGSTVGAMMAANTNIKTLDLGVPILAMHSIRETLATEDQISLNDLLYHTLMDENLL